MKVKNIGIFTTFFHIYICCGILLFGVYETARIAPGTSSALHCFSEVLFSHS